MPRSKNPYSGTLIPIVLLAAFLRLFFFIGILRGDDLGYYLLADQLADGSLLPASWGGLNRPGLYVPVSLFIGIFGSSEFVALIFPLLASMLTLGFIYGIGRLLSGEKAALVSAIIWAVAPLDVFLASQLMPDGPSVMMQTGAIFFLLLGLRGSRRKVRLVSFALMLLFFYWSLQTKESNLILVFPIFGITLFELSPWIKLWTAKILSRPRTRLILALLLAPIVILLVGAFVRAQVWPIAVNNLELTSSDTASLWFLGRSNPISASEVGAGYWIVDRPVLEVPMQFQALTQPILGERVRVFDPFVPFFLVSALAALFYKQRASYLPLIWFFVLFFYLEWGSFTQGFFYPDILRYLPVTHWIDPRNLHMLSPPAILVIGFFVAQHLERVFAAKYVLLGAGALALFAITLSSDVTMSIIQVGLLVSVVGAVLLVFLPKAHAPTLRAELVAGLLLLSLLLASLLPVPHFHVSGYFKEQARRTNLQEVLAYLDTQPVLPISNEGAIGWLDLYSGFALGVDHFEQGIQSNRVAEDLESLQQTGGYRVLYGCGQPIQSHVDWPIKEFGQDLGPKTCVSLVRVFAEDQISEAVVEARQAAMATLSLEDIRFYLAAAMQGNDLAEASYALALFATYFSEQMPIIQASNLLSVQGPRQLNTHTTDLLTQISACVPDCNWSISPLLEPRIIGDGSDAYLSIHITSQTEETQFVKLPVRLGAATTYILHLEFRSFAPYDLVRLSDGAIPDSYSDSWNRDLDWKSLDIVFVTPAWSEGSRLVDLELARVFDRGEIEFRQIDLVELSERND